MFGQEYLEVKPGMSTLVDSSQNPKKKPPIPDGGAEQLRLRESALEQYRRNEALLSAPTAKQEGGTHYRDRKIQPITYIMENKLGFCEGNIVKYITRWRDKGGVEDLRKVIHYAEFLIAEAEAEAVTGTK